MSRRRRGKRAQKRKPTRGFPLDNLDGTSLDILYEQLARRPCPSGSDAQRVSALREILLDGERWDPWLAELPALSLIALEILVEARGSLEVMDLDDLVQLRTLCDEDAAYIARVKLLEHHLVVPLGERGKSETKALCIYEDTLPLLDERLRGVSLPVLPEELASASSENTSDAELCRTLAVAGLTGHRRLRFTRTGAPDRTTLKSFAKHLGASVDEVFLLAERAMGRGLVRAYGENLTPCPTRMLEEARGQGDASAPDSWLESWLEPGGWVSLAALVRARVRAHLTDSPEATAEHGFAPGFVDIPPLFRFFEERVRTAKSLEHRTVGGIDWVRRPILPEVVTGDGHVTPSFEVMLGPAVHPELVAIVALGCELQRIDRVLTFRITPKSVAQGKTAGLAAGELRAALDAVGRHPLAENVAQLVDEWEAACTVASVSNGWFLFAGSELQSVLEKSELAPFLLGSPMPGVLELDPATPRPQLEAALAEHRVQLSLSYPLARAEAQRDSDRLAPLDLYQLDDAWDNDWQEPNSAGPESLLEVERPWSLEPAGAPMLRERVELARASGFTDDLPTGTTQHAVAGALDLEIGEDPVELRRHIDSLGRDASRELNRFRRKLSLPSRDLFDAACSDGLSLLPFLALKPKWRRRIVRAAENLEELVDFAMASAEHGHCTSQGEHVLELLSNSRLAAAMGVDTDFIDEPDTLHAPHGSNLRNDAAGSNAPVIPRNDQATKRPSGGKFPRAERRDTVAVEFDDDAHAPSHTASAHPAVDEFPELGSHELFVRLSEAVQFHRAIYALIESDTGLEVRALSPDRIEIRGNRQVLLAEDLDSGEGRVVHVRSIRSMLE